PLGYKCIQVNLFGVLNTVHLAQHYLTRNRKDNNDLKAVVLLGSMASWLGIPSATQYTASKHAVLGVMRSMHPIYERLNIRIATIHPFFAGASLAIRTLVPLPVKIFLTGIPLVPVPRIAKAITYAASNPDPATSGCAYLLPDGGEVFKIPKEEFKLGVYKVIDERANALSKAAGG
ncbi:NAD(P)-binding protein, partial [Marasmius fiardii PR-910]